MAIVTPPPSPHPDDAIAVPDDPGLGVEYDWEFVEANRTGQRVYE